MGARAWTTFLRAETNVELTNNEVSDIIAYLEVLHKQL